MQRGSDMAGVWLYTLLQSLGVTLVGYSRICAAGMIAAIGVLGLGRAFQRRQRALRELAVQSRVHERRSA